MFLLIKFTKVNESVQLSIRHLGKKHHWRDIKESGEKQQVCVKSFDEPRRKVEAEIVTEEQEQEAEKHWCETVKTCKVKILIKKYSREWVKLCSDSYAMLSYFRQRIFYCQIKILILLPDEVMFYFYFIACFVYTSVLLWYFSRK
jgi:hypothetical protein